MVSIPIWPASCTGLDLPALPLPLLLSATIQVPVNLRAKDLHDTPWRAQAHGAAPVTQSNGRPWGGKLEAVPGVQTLTLGTYQLARRLITARPRRCRAAARSIHPPVAPAGRASAVPFSWVELVSARAVSSGAPLGRWGSHRLTAPEEPYKNSTESHELGPASARTRAPACPIPVWGSRGATQNGLTAVSFSKRNLLHLRSINDLTTPGGGVHPRTFLGSAWVPPQHGSCMMSRVGQHLEAPQKTPRIRARGT